MGDKEEPQESNRTKKTKKKFNVALYITFFSSLIFFICFIVFLSSTALQKFTITELFGCISIALFEIFGYVSLILFIVFTIIATIEIVWRYKTPEAVKKRKENKARKEAEENKYIDEDERKHVRKTRKIFKIVIITIAVLTGINLIISIISSIAGATSAVTYTTRHLGITFSVPLIVIGIIYIVWNNTVEAIRMRKETAKVQAELPQIIQCPMCGNEVSNKAKSYPHCGHPIDTLVYCLRHYSMKFMGIALLIIGIILIIVGASVEIPSSYLTYLSSEDGYQIERYVGGDAYNYIIGAELCGAEITAKTIEKTAYICTGIIVAVAGAICTLAPFRKGEKLNIKNND